MSEKSLRPPSLASTAYVCSAAGAGNTERKQRPFLPDSDGQHKAIACGGRWRFGGDSSNPQGSRGKKPSELMRGSDRSEARRATAQSQRMAEREGFEPSERLRAQRFSRPPRSTTPAPLRIDEMSWSQSATVHIEVRRAAQGADCDFPRRFFNACRALCMRRRDGRAGCRCAPVPAGWRAPPKEAARIAAQKRREPHAQALTLASRSVYSRCFAKGPKVSLPVARGIPPIPATLNSRPDKDARTVSNSAGRTGCSR